NGTKPQATCDRKLPGSVVLVDSTGTPPPTPGFWGVFGYFAYLPRPGSVTANYVFYGNTGPETDIVKYPFVMCSKKPITS
ncbi:hypothetical protein AAVH_34527, partial [Aphelenchoides avenae]